MENLIIRHHIEWERFELLESDLVIGKAAYKDYQGDYDGGAAATAGAAGSGAGAPETGPGERIFYHTVIEEEYGGQGLAGKLVTEALDQTVAAGLKIVPVCPFVKDFVAKHPEYRTHVLAVKPAHLGFLEDALAQRAARQRG